jgi:hypothetical protein
VFASSTWRASDASAELLAHTDVATLSLSGVANEDLKKTLRISRTAPMQRARRGMVPRTVSPAFQVKSLLSKKGRLWLEDRLLVLFISWHPVLSWA